ncbi:hypothetical protein OIU76_004272 [Salix suchowensis]|nr:hypothetical protein OIU76_004272 [Salix suchowensis]
MVLLLLLSTLAFDVSCTKAFLENGDKIKSRTFQSPEFMLGPGSVESNMYYDIDFPRGHIALKSFNAEVVDQAGNPVPLYETYFHHWLVGKYYERRPSDRNFSRNSGLCQGQILGQYFGLGSETRKTATHIPDPFGVEIGNPDEIPEGYQEKVTLLIPEKRLHGLTGISPENGCQVEYEVESCSATKATRNGCVDIKRTSLTMPTGGYVIYAVAHQHVGGIGSTLYGQDGNIICTSKPIYGNGNEAGNEDGYIVGMSTCYPEPGSVKITAGENLTLESNYNNTNKHTGVMGLFYIYIAKQAPNMTFSHPPVQASFCSIFS